jgi:hypothetical protein
MNSPKNKREQHARRNVREREYRLIGIAVHTTAPLVPVLVLNVLSAPLLRLRPSSVLIGIAGDRTEPYSMFLLVSRWCTRVTRNLRNAMSEFVEVKWWFHVFLKMREVSSFIFD